MTAEMMALSAVDHPARGGEGGKGTKRQLASPIQPIQDATLWPRSATHATHYTFELFATATCQLGQEEGLGPVKNTFTLASYLLSPTNLKVKPAAQMQPIT